MMGRSAEEWGRLAVSLPGWRWMPGILGRNENGGTDRIIDWTEASQANPDIVPDPDDPATEGCLVRLLGPVHEAVWYTGDCDRWVVAVGEERRLYTSLGRACIAAAEALGRWPNVAESGRMVAE